MKKLILVDPWGFPVRDPSGKTSHRIPVWIRVLGHVLSVFNLFCAIRAAGPLGICVLL